MKEKSGFLSDLTRRLFNSLDYEDWSTSQPNPPKLMKKGMSNSKSKNNNGKSNQMIKHEIHT